MKILISAVFALFLSGQVMAAEGNLVYEAAASSVTSTTVALSSSAATLISRTEAQSLTGTGKKITWYSLTLFNVGASSAAYAFSSSATTGPVPTLTCSSDNAIPIGAGTATSPWNQTEQFQGMYMWGISCAADATVSIRTVHRGR